MKCTVCGKQEERLYAPKRGLCQRCYKNDWEKKARKDPKLGENIRARARRTYMNNTATAKEGMKKQRENRHFDGKRTQILEHYEYTCQRCMNVFEGSKLCIHHKDRNGRGKEQPNNEYENLVPLCRGCHAKEHAIELAKARGADASEAIGYSWSLKYPKCIECGTTDTRHKARGKCNNCYKRERMRQQKSNV